MQLAWIAGMNWEGIQVGWKKNVSFSIRAFSLRPPLININPFYAGYFAVSLKKNYGAYLKYGVAKIKTLSTFNL